jgi:hypothetical protein
MNKPWSYTERPSNTSGHMMHYTTSKPARTRDPGIRLIGPLHRARVLYILATNHTLPPTPSHFNLLTQSIELYRAALTSTPDPLLESDSAYNLAIGLIELADIAEDFQLPGTASGSHLPIYLNEDRVREIRLEARSLLEDVVKVQEGYIASQGGVQAFESDTLGDEPDADGDQEMAMSGSSTPGGAASYEEHIPTPTTLTDAILLIVDVDISLLGALDPDVSPEVLSSDFAVGTLAHAWAALARARQVNGETPSVPLVVKESELVLILIGLGMEIDLSLGSIVAPTLAGQTRLVRQCLDRMIALQQLASFTTTEVEAKLSFYDTLIELYKTSSRLNATEHAATAWEDLGKAVQACTAALELPFSVVTNPLSRASLSLELARVSLRRTFLPLAAAEKNLGTLLKNAETYANRCLVALSWGSMATEQTGVGAGSGTLSIGLGSGAATGNIPPTQGWDHERLARTATLTLLRILWIGSTESSTLGETTAAIPATMTTMTTTATATTAKAEKLLRSVKSLGKGSEDRKIGRIDVERFVEEVELEEGALREGEIGFWEGVVVELERGA